jgi:hypothetical protein
MHALDTLSKNQLIGSISVDEVQAAHNLGNHAAVKLDTTRGSLVHINCTHSERLSAKIELSESEVLQRTRQCGGENRLDDLLGHVGASDTDVGP